MTTASRRGRRGDRVSWQWRSAQADSPNRDLTMPIFRGDEEAALDQIERKLEIKRRVA